MPRGNSLYNTYTAVQNPYTNIIYLQVRKTATRSLVRYPHTTGNVSTKQSNTKIPYHQETSKIGNQRDKPRRQKIIKEINCYGINQRNRNRGGWANTLK